MTSDAATMPTWIVVCLVACGACAEDTVRPAGFDFDGSPDAGDTKSPPPVDSIVPQDPPESSICHENWCWLHPRPFGHDVRDLRQRGDKLLGVAVPAPLR